MTQLNDGSASPGTTLTTSLISSEGKSMLVFCFTYRAWVRVAILGLALLGALAGVASPAFQKVFVDRLLGSVGAGTMGDVWNLSPATAIFIAFACTLLSQAFGLLGNFLSIREGAFLQRVFSEDLYRKMLSIRPDSMGTTTIGEVVSLYATDVAGSTALIDQVLPMAASIFFNMACAPLAVYYLCGIPMWATLAVMATVFALILVLATRQSRFFARFKQLAAERTGIVNEWVQTIRLLRILGWVESFERKIFVKREEETANRVAMVSNGQLMNAFGSSINFVLNLVAVGTLIYLSGRHVNSGQLFAMLWIFGVFLARSFRQIPWFLTFTLDSITSMRRLERFLGRTSDAGRVEEAMDRDAGASAADEAAELCVQGLNLSIGGQPILRDISFSLKAGEFVAVVGEVGSGKSLLVLSLVGEVGATFERFEIGKTDARKLDLIDRRRFFTFVPQEGFVMTASLRENIVFQYEPESTHDPEVLRSLTVAQFRLIEEIQGPGLDTEIGERGVNLSGGQRQRVGLARAHFNHRPIVLLDDCLSAVDVDTEKELLENLIDGAWKGQTRLLVTHRLSVLHQVDRIFFMERGRIVDTGTFAELIKRSAKMQEFVASVSRAEAKAEATSALKESSAPTPLTEQVISSATAESETEANDVETQTLP